MRQRPALFLLLSCCACSGFSAGDERPGIPPRHLFLVTVGGLRADHTSLFLYPRPTTWTEVDGGLVQAGRALSIDDLGESGVVFARAFAPSGDPLTSLASVLTGRSPLETGVLAGERALRPDLPTLARSFAAAGFRCAAFVSAPEPRLGPGWRAGFSTFLQLPDDPACVGRAIDWLGREDLGDGGGRFVWLHLNSPSFPFEPKQLPGHAERGGAMDFAQRFADPAYAGAADGSAAFRATGVPLDEADERHLVALYDGEVAQTKHLLEYLLDYFVYAGAPTYAFGRTALVLAGTNGVELFERGTHGDADLAADPVLHVPLFLRHPDSLTGRRILEDVVELEDIAATALDWFGLEDSTPQRSHSLLEWADAPRPRQRGDRGGDRRAFAVVELAQGELAFSLRDPSWRLVWRPQAPEGEALALYDQEYDRSARDDLARDHPGRVAAMQAELRAWLASLDLAPDVALRALVPE